MLALQESCVEEQVASAFPVEARQEEVVEAGTLDEVVDLRDDKISFMDEEEIERVARSRACHKLNLGLTPFRGRRYYGFGWSN